jgi:hypothetical protein
MVKHNFDQVYLKYAFDPTVSELTKALQVLDNMPLKSLSDLPEWLSVKNEALKKAMNTFNWYGDMHAAKPDPEKAKRNYDLAVEMEKALNAQ